MNEVNQGSSQGPSRINNKINWSSNSIQESRPRLYEYEPHRNAVGQSQQLKSFRDLSNLKSFSKDNDSDRENQSMPIVARDQSNRRSKEKALCPELKSQGLFKQFVEDASDPNDNYSRHWQMNRQSIFYSNDRNGRRQHKKSKRTQRRKQSLSSFKAIINQINLLSPNDSNDPLRSPNKKSNRKQTNTSGQNRISKQFMQNISEFNCMNDSQMSEQFSIPKIDQLDEDQVKIMDVMEARQTPPRKHQSPKNCVTNKSHNNIPLPSNFKDMIKRNSRTSVRKQKLSHKIYSSQSDTGIQHSQTLDNQALLNMFEKHLAKKMNMAAKDEANKDNQDKEKKVNPRMHDLKNSKTALDEWLIIDIVSSLCLTIHERGENSLERLWLAVFCATIGVFFQVKKQENENGIHELKNKFRIAHLPFACLLCWLLCQLTDLECFVNSLWLLSSVKIYRACAVNPEKYTHLKMQMIMPLLVLLVHHIISNGLTISLLIKYVRTLTFVISMLLSLFMYARSIETTEESEKQSLTKKESILEQMKGEIREFKLSMELKKIITQSKPLQDSNNSGKLDQKQSSQTEHENNNDAQILELQNSQQRESVIDRRQSESIMNDIIQKFIVNKSMTASSIQNYQQFQFENILMKNIGKHVMVFNVDKSSNKNQEKQAFFSDTEQINRKICKLNFGRQEYIQSLRAATMNLNEFERRQIAGKKVNKKSQYDMNFIKISANFFEDLPFYKQIDHIFCQMSHKTKYKEHQKVRSSIEEGLLIHSRDQMQFIKNMEQLNHSQIVNPSMNQSKNPSKQSLNLSLNKPAEQQIKQNGNKVDESGPAVAADPCQAVQNLQNANLAPIASNSDLDKSNQTLRQNTNQPCQNPLYDLNGSNNKENYRESVNSFIDLTKMQREMMDLKIFEPYFYNHRTMLEYHQKTQYSSINDILKKCTKNFDKKSTTRLFFKVYLNDNIVIHILNNQSTSKKAKLTDSKAIKTDSNQQLSKNQNLSFSLGTEQLRNGGDQIREKKPMSKIDEIEYKNYDVSIELDMNKTLEIESDSVISSKFQDIDKLQNHNDDQINYFEFEITHIGKMPNGYVMIENCFILNIKDVTHLVKSQQRLSDSIYREAIESNFSHQQMTPLNYLTTSSSMINEKVITMFKQNQLVLQDLYEQLEFGFDEHSFLNDFQERFELLSCQNISMTKEILKITDENNQSAFALWFLNQSQIKKMQIHQNKFHSTTSMIDDISQKINKVFEYFKKKIKSKNLNVFIAYRDVLDIKLIADWEHFILILYNVIHNAIKYNYCNGEIFIIITRKKHKKKQAAAQRGEQRQSQIQEVQRFHESNNDINLEALDQILEIEIIDTGEGIHPDRQNHIFVPFMELKQLQGLMNKSKNNNMSLGLSASKQIVRELKGDLIIKHSQQGLTIFQMRFPVKVLPRKNQKQQYIGVQHPRIINNNIVDNQSDSDSNQIIEQVAQNSSNDQQLGPSGTSLEVNRDSSLNQPAGNSSSSEPRQHSQYESSILLVNTKIMQIFGQKRRGFSPLLNSYLQRNFNSLCKQIVHFVHLENSQYKKQGYEFFQNGGHPSLNQQNLRKILPRFVSMSSGKLSHFEPDENSEEEIEEIEQIPADQEEDSGQEVSQSRDESQIDRSVGSIDQYENLISQINQNELSSMNLAQLKKRLINNDDHVEHVQSINEVNADSEHDQREQMDSQSVPGLSQSNDANRIVHQLDQNQRQVNSQRAGNEMNSLLSAQQDSLVYSDSNQHEKNKFLFKKLKSRTVDKLKPKNIGMLKSANNQKQLKYEMVHNNQKHPLNKFVQQYFRPQNNVAQNCGALNGDNQNQRQRQQPLQQQNDERGDNQIQEQQIAPDNQINSSSLAPQQQENQIVDQQIQDDEIRNLINSEHINSISESEMNCIDNQDKNARIRKEKISNQQEQCQFVLDLDVNDDESLSDLPQIKNVKFVDKQKNQKHGRNGQAASNQQQRSNGSNNNNDAMINNSSQAQVENILDQIHKNEGQILQQNPSRQMPSSDSSNQDKGNKLKNYTKYKKLERRRDSSIGSRQGLQQSRGNQGQNSISSSIQQPAQYDENLRSALADDHEPRSSQMNRSQQRQINRSQPMMNPVLSQLPERSRKSRDKRNERPSQKRRITYDPSKDGPNTSDSENKRNKKGRKLVNNQNLSPINEIDAESNSPPHLKLLNKKSSKNTRQNGRKSQSSNKDLPRNSGNLKSQANKRESICGSSSISPENNRGVHRNRSMRIEEEKEEDQSPRPLLGQNISNDSGYSKSKSSKLKRIKFNQSMRHIDCNRPYEQLNFKYNNKQKIVEDNILSGSIKNKKKSNSNQVLQVFDDENCSEYDKRLEKIECRSEIMCSCKPSILIVDDDPFNLKIESFMVEKELKKFMGDDAVKKIVQQATDGTIAVDLVKQQLQRTCKCRNRVYKLIVMDLQMQEMDGDEATKEINKMILEENLRMKRQRPYINVEDIQLTCNIVACTANTTQNWHQRAKDSGMVFMINKPMNQDSTLEILNKWFFTSRDIVRPQV